METATYGYEFISDLTCVEHTIDLRNTIQYLGVSIRHKSYMFGNNKSIVDSVGYPNQGSIYSLFKIPLRKSQTSFLE